ncbi:MAG: hypothetical protein KGO47_07380 [Cyanobacteria bacterium REEB417]|nr:hypothetical protein [Cyanobacteria bacterium REEB417]
MKTHQINRLLNTADEWLRPWATVTPDPAGDGEGGGGDSSAEDGDGAPLGPAGERALREERALRKAQTQELEELRAQMEQMKGLVDPKVYAQAQEQATALRRQLDEKERLTAEERQRLEAKANERVSKAEARAQKAENDRIALQVKTAAQSLFLATDGRDGGDATGQTYFDAWFAFHGRRHLRVDPNSGAAYVVDSDGDRVKTADGQDVNPVAWLNEQADNSAVVGSFFKPRGGAGSGGFTGARGVRTTQGLTPEQVKSLSPSQKMALHREAAGAR